MIVYITVKAKSTVFMVFLLHSPANEVKDVFTALSVNGVCDLALFRIYELVTAITTSTAGVSTIATLTATITARRRSLARMASFIGLCVAAG